MSLELFRKSWSLCLCVASNAVLKKWLVDNGVECRARERKEVLIRLVTQHIQNTGKTFNL